MEINIGILVAQGINFLVLLFLFKRLVGDALTKTLIERRTELAKAEDATKIYEETILKAEEEKKSMLSEALAHKQQLMEEAKISAKQQADRLLEDAQKNAVSLMKAAEDKAQKLSQDIEENFVEGVRRTAKIVVNKLFDKDVQLQESYIDELVKEYKKSSS